jgi:hypothetical protein
VSKVHDFINHERKKRGVPHVYWSRGMARLAQSQANYCAKVGRLVHSNKSAFQGGENLAEGGNNFSPRAIVDCWLNSKAGHREYLLSARVKKAGVGIAKSGGRTFVAWSFSDSPPSYPDCPYYKAHKHKPPSHAWPGMKGLDRLLMRLKRCLPHRIRGTVGTRVVLTMIGGILIWVGYQVPLGRPMTDENIMSISMSGATFGFVVLMFCIACLGTILGVWKRKLGGFLTIIPGVLAFLAMMIDPNIGFTWPLVGPTLLVLSGGSSLWYLIR